MKQKTIFVFAYYSYKDPVFQSAVLPYFENFPQKEKYRFVLLTFEQDRYTLSNEEIKSIRKLLLDHNIIWYKTKWHSGRFKLLKKAFDFVWGFILSLFLVLRYKAKFIYSEGFPGAIISHFLARFSRRKHIVHTFEPHADYMIESGVWSAKDWEARFLKRLELKVANDCSHIFTATNAMIEKLTGLGVKAQKHRVPSCVDLSLFKFSEEKRTCLRKKYHIAADECLIVYLGKFGGMYMEDELFDFFAYCKNKGKVKYRFLVLTPDAHQMVKEVSAKKGIIDGELIVETLPKEKVPDYLSAADFGFVGIRSISSRRYSSPIKDGEYWACGLPIIIPDGISDDYLLAEEHQIGIRLKGLSEDSFAITLKQMEAIWEQSDLEAYRRRSRAFVQKDRDVEKYKELYEKIFSS
ncbi:hypothetical protein [Xanthovirga aplysinae]|uniref:hypothetical protein n=1 Tax=Xanthovirga aplysinae TaxID=2529853 RepID=UPI0012BB566C|nr:hypothetical protein [Xanthovirga aplysinae]MTI32483.1 hypothetical protein [Xanthovirga aplysinae]